MSDDDAGAFVPGQRFRLEGRDGGPLAGLTFAAKDLFDVAGRPTGGGNPDWERVNPIPARHAWAVQRLLDAGATLIGKTITDEVSLGILGENPFDGTARNPRAPAGCPAAPRRARRSRSPQAFATPRLAPIPAARCECRRASAGSTASARHTAGSI
jgi:amidase